MRPISVVPTPPPPPARDPPSFPYTTRSTISALFPGEPQPSTFLAIGDLPSLALGGEPTPPPHGCPPDPSPVRASAPPSATHLFSPTSPMAWTATSLTLHSEEGDYFSADSVVSAGFSSLGGADGAGFAAVADVNLDGANASVSSLAFCPLSVTLAVGTTSGLVRIYKLREHTGGSNFIFVSEFKQGPMNVLSFKNINKPREQSWMVYISLFTVTNNSGLTVTHRQLKSKV
eukprot:XP_020398842.1 classical arabinogalactan protein 9 [Zea mays]